MQAGAYTVSVSILDTKAGKEGTARAYFTIRKKIVSGLTLSDPNVEYDGNEHPVAVSGNDEGLIYTVTYSDENGGFVSAPVNAGVYTATLTVTEDNYEGEIVQNVTISPSIARIVMAADRSFEYTGRAFDARALITLKKNANTQSDYSDRIEFEYVFAKRVGNEWQEINNIPTVPGSYGVRARFSDADNFVNVEWVPGDGDFAAFTITKATVTVQLKNVSVYNNKENAIVYGYLGEVFKLDSRWVSLVNSAGDEVTLDINVVYKKDGVVTTPTDKGEYVIEISASGNDCYNAVAMVSIPLFIVEKSLSDGDGIELVGENTFVWNGEVQVPEIRITPDDIEPIKNYFRYDPVSAQYDAVSESEVVLPAKYRVSVLIQNVNYSGDAMYDFEITKREVSVTLSGIEFVYGSTSPVTVTVTYDDAVIDDIAEINVVYYESNDEGRGKRLASMPINAGAYRVEAVISDPRYRGRAESGFVINKKTLYAKFVDVSYVYNKKAPELNIAYTGFEYDDNAENALKYLPTLPSEAMGYIDVGTYTVTPEGGTANNYVVECRSGTVTINKQNLTIGLNHVAEGYKRGSSLNLTLLSFSYEGFVVGDTASNCIEDMPKMYFDLDGDGNYETAADRFSSIPAGKYYVKLAGASAKNYNCYYKDPNDNIIDIYEYTIANSDIELSGVQMSDTFTLNFAELSGSSADYSSATKAAKSYLSGKSVLAVYDYNVLSSGEKLTNDTHVTLTFKHELSGVDFDSDKLTVYQISEKGMVSEVAIKVDEIGRYYVDCNGISGKLVFATKKDYTWLIVLIVALIVSAGVAFAVLFAIKRKKELKAMEKERGDISQARPEDSQQADEGDFDIDLDEAERIYREAEKRAKENEREKEDDSSFGFTAGGVKMNKADLAQERLMQISEQSGRDLLKAEADKEKTKKKSAAKNEKEKTESDAKPKVAVAPKAKGAETKPAKPSDKKSEQTDSAASLAKKEVAKPEQKAKKEQPAEPQEIGLTGEIVEKADDFSEEKDFSTDNTAVPESELFDFEDLDI